MILFDKDLSRIKILACKKNINTNAKIFVHRNHSFEMIGNILNAFLNFSSIEAEIEYSSYDDSLTFNDLKNADLHILWLDLNRYNKDLLNKFISDKIQELRNNTNSPILLAYLGDGLKDNNIKIKDLTIVNINKVIEFLQDKGFDLEKEALSGTKLSSKACLSTAQYLGLKIIPSILKPALKAIVLDLDNTLYKGIIGEDGIENIVPYNRLQRKLKEFKEQGFLLCISSKNEEQDVKKLFYTRNDFILNWNDFTSVKVNWNAKSDNIVEIAKELNIGTDSILFIDDNIAEIENVKAVIGDIHSIIATDEETTLRYLDLYPCLIKNSISKEDLIRSKDLQANKERQELAKTLSKEEYFKKLGIQIELTLNDKDNINRIAELLNKTNQFILSYKRYNITEVEKLLNSSDSCVVTAKMSDKLSDSGIIAILIAKKESSDLIVDELTFSCRALGRNIEDIVISKMLSMAKDYLHTTSKVSINYQKGPRNVPALTWLENYTNEHLEQEGIVVKELADNIETYGLEMKEVVCVK